MIYHIRNITFGALAGLAISAALFGPALVSIERATPSGFNVFVGDNGFHFAMGGF